MQSHYKYGEMFCDSILTSYRIYGDPASQLMPLIILHGGPSGGFDYLLNYHELSDDGRMVIFTINMVVVVRHIFRWRMPHSGQ